MAKDPLKFDKKTYWDRRKKGYRGQVSAPGTREFAYEQRRVFRKMRADQFEQLEKGVPNERKNRKSPAKSLQS